MDKVLSLLRELESARPPSRRLREAEAARGILPAIVVCEDVVLSEKPEEPPPSSPASPCVLPLISLSLSASAPPFPLIFPEAADPLVAALLLPSRF